MYPPFARSIRFTNRMVAVVLILARMSRDSKSAYHRFDGDLGMCGSFRYSYRLSPATGLTSSAIFAQPNVRCGFLRPRICRVSLAHDGADFVGNGSHRVSVRLVGILPFQCRVAAAVSDHS